MLKTLALATLLATATGAAALPYATTDRFTHEKSGYVVKVRTTGDQMRLRGRHPATGETFDLVVTRAGTVRGRFAGQPVDYVMPDTPAQLATAHKALNAAQ